MACFPDGCCGGGGGGGGCVPPLCADLIGGPCSDCNPDVSTFFVWGPFGLDLSGVRYVPPYVVPYKTFIYNPVNASRVAFCMRAVSFRTWRSDPITRDMSVTRYDPSNPTYDEFGSLVIDTIGLGIVDIVEEMTIDSSGFVTLRQLAYTVGTASLIAVMGTWRTLYPFDLTKCAGPALGPGTVTSCIAVKVSEYDRTTYPMPCAVYIAPNCCLISSGSSLAIDPCPSEQIAGPLGGSGFFGGFTFQGDPDKCGRPFKCIGGINAITGKIIDGFGDINSTVYLTLQATGPCSPLNGLVIPLTIARTSPFNIGFLGAAPYKATGGITVSGIPMTINYNADTLGPCNGTCRTLGISAGIAFGCQSEIMLEYLNIGWLEPDCDVNWAGYPNQSIVCTDIGKFSPLSSPISRFFRPFIPNFPPGSVGPYETPDIDVAGIKVDYDTLICDPLFAEFKNIPGFVNSANSFGNVTSPCSGGTLSAILTE